MASVLFFVLDLLGFIWMHSHIHCTLSLFLSAESKVKISASMDISVLGLYRYIGEYFYINIDISKINKNTLKFIEILCKSVKSTIIIKYTH